MSCQYSCQNRHVGDKLHNEDMSEKSRHSLAVKSDFLEEVHVRKVYEQIAPHICDLKQRTWPGVRDFLESLAPGSLVADVGKTIRLNIIIGISSFNNLVTNCNCRPNSSFKKNNLF